MVIRRIREHVVTHNWFAVAIDFLIVVAGIVIGTQVNNWNQARIERQQGKEYRERLIGDLRSNEAELLDRRTYYATVRRHAQAALAALDGPPGKDGTAFLVDAYQASQILTRHSKRFTFDELISTGRIEQLGDPNLREQVANYYKGLETTGSVFDFVPPYREHVRQLMPNAVQSAIRSRCSDRISVGADGGLLARLPDSCPLKLDPALISRAVATVRASPGLATDLTRNIADLDVKIDLLGVESRDAGRVRLLIERAGA
jgi:hypothetical protein